MQLPSKMTSHVKQKIRIEDRDRHKEVSDRIRDALEAKNQKTEYSEQKYW